MQILLKWARSTTHFIPTNQSTMCLANKATRVLQIKLPVGEGNRKSLILESRDRTKIQKFC